MWAITTRQPTSSTRAERRRRDRARPGPLIAAGRTLGDRYVLQRRLGAGGMSVVWLATDERLDRPVAIKILSDTLTEDREYIGRFRREAKVAAGLQHPNLVSVYDFGSGERPYLVMEYIDGGDLAMRVERGDVPDRERLARELLAALRHIHDAGVLHRDIKPQNVLIDEHGHARLTDFGIAQPHDATSLTRTGRVIGTEAYIAPEVKAGDAASERSDLYALGVLLADIAREGAGAPLWTLTDRLRAADPAARPGSAAEALAELERATPTDLPGAATQPSRSPRRAGRSSPTPTGGAARQGAGDGEPGDPPPRRPCAATSRSRVVHFGSGDEPAVRRARRTSAPTPPAGSIEATTAGRSADSSARPGERARHDIRRCRRAHPQPQTSAPSPTDGVRRSTTRASRWSTTAATTRPSRCSSRRSTCCAAQATSRPTTTRSTTSARRGRRRPLRRGHPGAPGADEVRRRPARHRAGEARRGARRRRPGTHRGHVGAQAAEGAQAGQPGAARADRWPCPRASGRGRLSFSAQRPTNRGGRFSANATTPSMKSRGEALSRCWASASASSWLREPA